MQVIILTSLALIAFALNSVLCRLALIDTHIDPASFTAVRLASGAITLVLLLILTRKNSKRNNCPISGFFLFLYAISFSLAYVTLGAGTGALILFLSVQLTILLAGYVSGDRFSPSKWLGLALALFGLVYLLSPSLNTPTIKGLLLMSLAGVSWGVYTLLGFKNTDPVPKTTANFIWATPFALITCLFYLDDIMITTKGVLLAIASGAMASGLGYVIWYKALKSLTSFAAASVQLSVPVLAALGGAAFLSEELTFRFALSALLILGGVLLTLGKNKSID